MGKTLVTAPALEPITVLEAARHLEIGAPATEMRPASPTVALAGAGAGNVDNGTHRYRVTFVTADGETDGGDPSESVTVADKTVNGKVTVSDIPIGGARVTSRKLYRTAAGGSTYLLVATIGDNTTTSYTDNIADASLGVGCPSTNTTDDPFLTALIAAARAHVENDLDRALVTQTWDATFDRFPRYADECLRLPRPPLQAVLDITYIDSTGTEATLSDDVYVVDTSSLYGEVSLAYGQSWPATWPQRNAVTVRFRAGYGNPASVPGDIVAAIKLVLADLHKLRSAGITGTIHTANPTVNALLGPYRLLGMA